MSVNHEPHIKCDKSAQNLLHARVVDGVLYSSINPKELLKDKISKNELMEEGVFHLLNVNFLPFPKSVLPNFYTAGPEDELVLDKGDSVFYVHEDMLLQVRSQKDQKPDTSHLLKLLVESTENLTKGYKTPTLMLSSGKDSVSLALALSRTSAKENAQCVTFVNGTERDEDGVAKEVCHKLGLQHDPIRIDVKSTDICDQLEKFYEGSVYPSTDQATIPYVACAAQVDGVDCMLDGTGNDGYFGLVPPSWHVKKDKIFPYGFPLRKLIRPMLSRRNTYSRLFLNRPEAHIGNFMLSYEELEAILPSAKESEYRDYWEEVGKDTVYLSGIDLSVNTKLHSQDRQQVMRKLRSVAEAFEFKAAFPWASEALVDYCFNLPEEYRFNRATRENKILVRQMLKDFLDYDATKVGKHVFRFEGETFLNTHRKWVEAQILECDFWKERGTRGDVEKLLAKLYKEMNSGMRAKNAIIGLLQVSGWVNHSRFLKS